MDIQQRKFSSFTDRVYSKGIEKENRVRMVREIFSRMPARTVLDVGCADGELLRPFINQHEIHGLDFTEGFVHQARQVGIRAQTCDFSKEAFPFNDASFDCVFTGETIEHLIDTDFFLSQINRVLKPNAELILTAPNVRTPVSLLMLALLRLPPQFSARYRSPHYRDFTLKTLSLALKHNGFRITQCEGASMYVPGLGETLEFAAKRIPSWSSQIVIRA